MDWTLATIVWGSDRGFASDKNRYLRTGNHHYIIGEKLRSGSPQATAALSRQGRCQDVMSSTSSPQPADQREQGRLEKRLSGGYKHVSPAQIPNSSLHATELRGTRVIALLVQRLRNARFSQPPRTDGSTAPQLASQGKNQWEVQLSWTLYALAGIGQRATSDRSCRRTAM
ncbi:hypothetical protein [Nonomuraea sp. NPDC050786]|uniref:hypothetical protein n=1 Tax=Nonomuraea sp. NPDC050786 TaxID=3154840 RepID=UPI0033E37F3B